MRMKKNILVFICFFTVISGYSQDNYQPSNENLKARAWFEEARFGMFIHWGVYSILGDGEWVMNNQNIAIENYEKLPQFFNPTEFDAQEWVKLAKEAGMKYITITSRHHDGFSMFDTHASDYNIVDGTPYKKDIIKELAEACRKEGIKLFFYYSLIDWRHKDYFPKGRTGNGIADKNTSGNWEDYIAFMKVQLTELLTNYGDIGGFWFDGHWDKPDENWHYEELYKLIHDLQPHALIGNNHHIAPFEGEDFQMFERDLPGKNTTGFGTDPDDIGVLPKEVSGTINGSWGFDLQDRKHKSVKELIHYLVGAAGHGSNLLLNVGPMPNGKIQENHIASLKKVGQWMEQYGDLIYGSHAGPFSPTDTMVSTMKNGKTYVYLLEDKDVVFIDGKQPEITSINFYDSGNSAEILQTDYGVFLEVPIGERSEIVTILEVEFK